ncbi:MAG: nucleotidyltransferase family protein [Chloroflexi bacterium]|nr:nucleotidyltransferase family protein [Chloroflexota bacterium]
MSKLKIKIPRKELAEFCRRNHIRKLAFFGSVLRDDFGPNSDIDILVEFEPGKTPGFGFVGMAYELEKIFKRQVDLATFKGAEVSRNPIRRKEIIETAKVYYVSR